MLNIIWFSMILLSILFGIIEGRLDKVVQAVTDSAKMGFDLALGLAGVMTLWLGIMGIASESGLMLKIVKILKPLLRPLFPDVPASHPAMGAIVFNISANFLGLANAATPFGIEAMKELQKLNKNSHEASDAMCTFLAINTSSVQLIPATAIAFLAANGSANPSSIIFSTVLATTVSTLVAIFAVKQLARLPFYRLSGEAG